MMAVLTELSDAELDDRLKGYEREVHEWEDIVDQAGPASEPGMWRYVLNLRQKEWRDALDEKKRRAGKFWCFL